MKTELEFLDEELDSFGKTPTLAEFAAAIKSAKTKYIEQLQQRKIEEDLDFLHERMDSVKQEMKRIKLASGLPKAVLDQAFEKGKAVLKEAQDRINLLLKEYKGEYKYKKEDEQCDCPLCRAKRELEIKDEEASKAFEVHRAFGGRIITDIN
jgi:hypothetical protein